jgi:hypothetical protein
MIVTDLATLIDELPPGPDRTAYKRLRKVAGSALLVLGGADPDLQLWLVKRQRQARVMVAHGFPRSCIWTLAELRDWLGPVESLAEAAEMLAAKD